MNYKIVNKDKFKYAVFASGEKLITSEQSVMDLIAVCFENEVDTVILDASNLSEDFFNLKTGLAGAALQKFINYHIKVGIIMDNKQKLNDRFKEMLMEANKGSNFRSFSSMEQAEQWILNL